MKENTYKESQRVARSPSVVLTTEDLLEDLNDNGIKHSINHSRNSSYSKSKWKNSEYVEYNVDKPVLTNEDLDNYSFLEAPEVIPENAYPMEKSIDSVVEQALKTPIKKRNLHREYWEFSKYVEDKRQGKPSYAARIAQNGNLADKWESNGTVTYKKADAKPKIKHNPKSKGLFKRAFQKVFRPAF